MNDPQNDFSGTALALVAVCLFSTSALLVRLAAPVSAVEVTFWRLLVAGLLVLGAARVAGQLGPGAAPPLLRVALYGLITAAHFGFYIAALEATTVANALAITYTAPVFVALFSALLLREPVTRRQSAGIVLVVVGVAVLAGYDLVTSAERALGDGLALLSALAFGLYSVAGRAERERRPLLAYAGTVYLVAAIWLLPVTVLGFAPEAYAPRNVLAILALAAVPLALGHTLYNAALRRIHAARANVLATLEVVGGALLAWAVLGEPVSAQAAVGVAITLAGVLVVVL